MLQDVFGETMEKVVAEDEADLQQLVGAEVVVCELSAKVLPRAAHLLGEPGDAPLLMPKFGFDEVSDVWGFVHIESVDLFVLSLTADPGRPNQVDKFKKSTLFSMNFLALILT